MVHCLRDLLLFFTHSRLQRYAWKWALKTETCKTFLSVPVCAKTSDAPKSDARDYGADFTTCRGEQNEKIESFLMGKY